jgi:hypothetical protein
MLAAEASVRGVIGRVSDKACYLVGGGRQFGGAGATF